MHKLPALKDHGPCEPKPPKIHHCTDHPEKALEWWCPENQKIYCSHCLANKQDTHKCELVADAMKIIADKVN